MYKTLRIFERIELGIRVNDYTGTKSLCTLELQVLRKFIII